MRSIAAVTLCVHFCLPTTLMLAQQPTPQLPAVPTAGGAVPAPAPAPGGGAGTQAAGCGWCETNAPPIVTIVTPATTVFTRTPVILVRYQGDMNQANDEINLATLSVTWGGVNVTSRGRFNMRLYEWEVEPAWQFTGPGQSKTLSVTICSLAGLCTTVNRNVQLAASPYTILSVTPMPLEALGSMATAAMGGGWAIQGTEFVTGVGTPTYTSWDTPRSAGLTFSTRQSYPRALVYADLEFPGGLPSSLTVKLWDGAALMSQFTQASPSCSSGGQPRCRVALRADYLSGSGNGITRKWLRIETLATIGGNAYGSVDSAEVVIVDRRTTPYGAGWWPTGALRAVYQGDDAVLVGSDGTATIYRGHQGLFISPPGSRDTLVIGSSGTLELRSPGGARVVFDTQGRLSQVLPGAGLPASLTLSYLSLDQVSQLTDPAG